MTETILLGRGREIIEIPRKVWEGHLARIPEHAGQRLAFLTETHHRVRRYVVRGLPVAGQPIEPAAIARALELPPDRVEAVLAELERNLFFLVRNKQGAVAWAYPVTVEPTPHRLTFQSGERLYGA